MSDMDFGNNAGTRYFLSMLQSTTRGKPVKKFRGKDITICLIVFGIFYAIGLLTA